VLSPNNVRLGEVWPASSDPTANSLEPPIGDGKPIGEVGDDEPKPAPPPDEVSEKIVRWVVL
jgi:hypothetical protein